MNYKITGKNKDGDALVELVPLIRNNATGEIRPNIVSVKVDIQLI